MRGGQAFAAAVSSPIVAQHLVSRLQGIIGESTIFCMSSSIGDDVPPELLGYQRDPQWRDMSDYLVHFTKTSSALVSMLAEGFIRPSGPFGWAKNISAVAEGHRSVCLSEIPLDMIDRLISRHGHHGLGFKRAFVTRSGGRAFGT
jgi:hypothetical protein